MGRPKGASDHHFWEEFAVWLNEVAEDERFKLDTASPSSLKSRNNKAIAAEVEKVLDRYNHESGHDGEPTTDRPVSVDPTHVYEWFNAKRRPRLQMLPVLAEALRREGQSKSEAKFELYRRLGLLVESDRGTLTDLIDETAQLGERRRKAQIELRRLEVRRQALAAALELQTITDAVLRSRMYAMTVWPAYEGPMDEHYRMIVAHRLDFKRLDRRDFAPRELREHPLVGPALESSRALASVRRPRWYLTIKKHVNYFDLPYTGLTRRISPHELRDPLNQRILIYSLTSQGWVDEIGDFLGRVLGLPFTSIRYTTYSQKREQRSGDRMEYMRQYLGDAEAKDAENKVLHKEREGEIVSYYGDLDEGMEEQIRKSFDMVVWLREDDDIMHHVALKKKDAGQGSSESPDGQQLSAAGRILKKKLMESRDRYEANPHVLHPASQQLYAQLLPVYHKEKHGEAVASVSARWHRVFTSVFEIARRLEGERYGSLCHPFIRASKGMPEEEQNTKIFALWLAERIITDLNDPASDLPENQRESAKKQLSEILLYVCDQELDDWFSGDAADGASGIGVLRAQAEKIFRQDPAEH